MTRVCPHCKTRGVPTELHDTIGGGPIYVGCMLCGRGEYKTPAPPTEGRALYHREAPKPALFVDDEPKPRRGRPRKHPLLTR